MRSKKLLAFGGTQRDPGVPAGGGGLTELKKSLDRVRHRPIFAQETSENFHLLRC